MTSKTPVRLLKVTALALFALLLNVGCESADDRQLASAQSCLDDARTEADANLCIEKVAGIETPAAYLVRCSANFIAQGFTGTRVASAFERMNDDTGTSGSDPMINIMGYLVFTGNSSYHNVGATVLNCQKSGVRSMERLALVAQLATETASLGGITNLEDLDPSTIDHDQLMQTIKTAIDAVAAKTPAELAALGQVAINLNSSLCGAGSSFEGEEVCNYMSDALAQAGSNDPGQLAKHLFAILEQK